MSTSERPNRFDDWLPGEYAQRGDFTVLVVLVAIEKSSIELVRSTFMNVVGDETSWAELRELFAGSGASWNGAAFFPVNNDLKGPVSNDLARSKLHDLEARLQEDRRILNDGHFFDRNGKRMKVEEITH